MLMRRHIAFIIISGVLSVFCAALLWEFGIEEILDSDHGLGEWREPASEKWEHVYATTLFSLVGMSAPMMLLLWINRRIKTAFVQLESAQREAQRNSESKSRFLAHMSHELRTPLNAILGFSQMMADGFFGPLKQPKYAEYVQDINDSAGHLLDLINDVLNISRLEAGEVDIDASEINVRTLIDGCMSLVEIDATAKNIEMHTETPSDMAPLQADERFIKQILINLLSNAVKFTPERGRVTVRAQQDADNIKLLVEDTGIGIAPENLQSVFEPFGQARVGPEYAHDGVGLGLSLSKELAELHGGELSIQSKIGMGTVVTLGLPRQLI
jgi:signal transduction histidine kinase